MICHWWGYNFETIQASGEKVKALIAREREQVGGDAKKVFLGGFS